MNMNGKTASISHSYILSDEYTIQARAIDERGASSEWKAKSVSTQKAKSLPSTMLLRLLEHFPLLEHLLEMCGFSRFLNSL